MNNDERERIISQERIVSTMNGWPMLMGIIILILAGVAMIIGGILNLNNGSGGGFMLLLGILSDVLAVFLAFGFFTLQPNEARVLILFGNYRGTVRGCGFHWANPLYSRGGSGVLTDLTTAAAKAQAHAAGTPMPSVPVTRKTKISLRLRNFNSEKLKVNDKRGNPIEIGAVIVWRVKDTAQAMFDVDNYENYVQVQSESAIRHLANSYAYDHGEDDEATETTLRSATEVVTTALCNELQVRLAKAGVDVEEARLTHLAYAPEIASAMLRRQQAEAIIAARQKIVHGAVSMVEMALNQLASNKVVQLDNERKAAMISNLLVVLCGESEVHPVVNTGTLYT